MKHSEFVTTETFKIFHLENIFNKKKSRFKYL